MSSAQSSRRRCRWPSAVACAVLLLPAAPARAWRFVDDTAAAGVGVEHGYVGITDPGPAEVQAGGVAAGDYDRDGWIDLYVTPGNAGPNRLLRNRGDGTFEERAAAAGVALTGVYTGPAFADVDGDGWLDLLVLGLVCPNRFSYCTEPSQIRSPPRLFRNRGDGSFEDVTVRSGLTATRDAYSAAFGDYDRDGDLDLFLTHWGDNKPGGVPSEHLWRNDGSGAFEDVSGPSGIQAAYDLFGEIGDLSFTGNFADLDSDGWPDLLVAGDFRTSKVFRNQRDGTFAETTAPVISDENGMGAAIGDYDNDGDLDWFVSSIWDPNQVAEGNWLISGNRLYRNQGDGTFEDATDAAGVRDGRWGWGSTFADFDNDGHLDLFHVNGWYAPGNPNDADSAEFHADPARLWIAAGDGTFTERAAERGAADTGQGRGVVAFDYDRDGDVDLFIVNNSGPARLLRNDASAEPHALTVRLRDTGTNSQGIGARVYVVSAGVAQMRELRAGNNFQSQDPAEAHFGLGSATGAETLRVVWPDGGETAIAALPADLLVTVSRDGTIELDPRATPVATATETSTATVTPTVTPSSTPTVSASATETAVPTSTATATPSATVSSTPTATASTAASVTPGLVCLGDCGGDDLVTVDELIVLVRIALGTAPATTCSAELPNPLGVQHLVSAVRHALLGCP